MTYDEIQYIANTNISYMRYCTTFGIWVLKLPPNFHHTDTINLFTLSLTKRNKNYYMTYATSKYYGINFYFIILCTVCAVQNADNTTTFKIPFDNNFSRYL